jgi:hypothetical protein
LKSAFNTARPSTHAAYRASMSAPSRSKDTMRGTIPPRLVESISHQILYTFAFSRARISSCTFCVSSSVSVRSEAR